jgi:hypothetical protein
MGPITGLLIAGGVKTVLGWFDTTEEDMNTMDNETQLKMAADLLGLNYAELRQKKEEFDQSMANRKDEFFQEMGLKKEDFALRKEETIRRLGLEERLGAHKIRAEATEGMEKLAEKKEKRVKLERFGAALQKTAKKPIGRPISPVKPGMAAPAPSVGATALRGAQQSTGMTSSTQKMSPLQHAGIV